MMEFGTNEHMCVIERETLNWWQNNLNLNFSKVSTPKSIFLKWKIISKENLLIKSNISNMFFYIFFKN